MTGTQKDFLIGLIVLIVFVYIVLRIIRAILKTIKWVFQTIWKVINGREEYNDPLKSEDWLVRAQARQEIRFQNSLPPILPEQKQKKKTVFKNQKANPKWYPTGWYFDEEKGKWIPPDYIEKEAKTRWEWDDNKRIWIDKKKKK